MKLSHDHFLPNFLPKKRLGQNFLKDKRVLSRIVQACELDPGETVLEIGPGEGALTGVVLPYVGHLIAVEADRALVPGLREKFGDEKLTVYQEDILKFDLSFIERPIKVIGNLPYYISTPIIEYLIRNREKVKSLFMTVQLEFAERLVALPGSKAYGSFSCFVQLHARPKILFKIPAGAFRPVPKVTSCFMRMDLRVEPAVAVKDQELLYRVIRMAFQQRRKSLLNSLGMFCDRKTLHEVLSSAGVPPAARAEDLSLHDFAGIADWLKSHGT
jgi:16S rRNA (adenine1518-N6/adenine1519-N6)-dimethyltransferase